MIRKNRPLRRIKRDELIQSAAARGYRTPKQTTKAKENEVSADRFTGLDRLILKYVREGPYQISASDIPEEHRGIVMRRVKALAVWDLSAPGTAGAWRIEPRFDLVLKAMQRTTVRHRLLSNHGSPVSDTSLQFSASSWTHIEGRVLVHGADEGTARTYMVLEGTDAKLHYVETSSLDPPSARRVAKLKVDTFVRLRRHARSQVDVEDLGSAEKLLGQPEHFVEAARGIRLRPSVTAGGWLGRYQNQLLLAHSRK